MNFTQYLNHFTNEFVETIILQNFVETKARVKNKFESLNGARV